MLAFYREYPDLAFVQQPLHKLERSKKGPQPMARTPSEMVQQPVAPFPVELVLALPWGHHGVLMAKVKDAQTRRWYMQATVENGWSRPVLLAQIETAAHARLGQAASNLPYACLRLIPTWCSKP